MNRRPQTHFTGTAMLYFMIALGLIALLLIIISLQPTEFCITRSATIQAPAETIFPHVNNLRKWEAWSPWAKMDPKATITFDGPAEGKGAGYTWAGNNQVGCGRMTITESQPPHLIRSNLEFTAPMKAFNLTEFTFKPTDKGTVVTWTMTGKNGFMAKAFGLFVNCDKMVGGQFEKGLAQMKALTEASSPKA